MRLIDETVTLELDGTPVRFRPSLRNALVLNEKHGEPEAIARGLIGGRISLYEDMLGLASLNSSECVAWFRNAPHSLKVRCAIVAPALFRLLVLMVGNNPDERNPASRSSGTPIPFNRALESLFSFATGVLHWPPETAWNATPREIIHAMKSFARMQPGYEPSAEERAESAFIEFDRSGFNALKNM